MTGSAAKMSVMDPTTLPRIQVVSAAISREDRYLVTQRGEQAVLPLLWEFPGGRVEAGESLDQALRRELAHRLGIDAEVCEQISQVERAYSDYVVELHLVRCEIGEQTPRPKAVRDLLWATTAELDSLAFTPADEASMRALLFG